MAQQSNNTGYFHLKKWLITEIPLANKQQTIKETFSILGKPEWELKTVEELFVVDESQKLVGLVPLTELFRWPKDTTIEKIMQTKFYSISSKTSPEKIAYFALKHGLGTVPIVEDGKLIGAIPSKNITSILSHSLRKQAFYFAGIHKTHLEYENSLIAPLFKTILHRAPWLIIGLIGVMLIAAFIGVFEKTLENMLF